ncbi:GlxA family transcriptional regulator [Desulfovibrio sp. JY]|nr:GlxA family transcriptional regulator [Desulfovibrio sp. JY]
MGGELKTEQREQGGGRPRRVVVFAPSPVLELDVVGPVNVFSAANKIRGKPRSYEILLATSKETLDVDGMAGVRLVAHKRYHDVRDDVDTLLVAGGRGAMTAGNPEVIAWLRDMASRVRRVGSICTGAFLLADAGLLDDRGATTHWEYARTLAARYPRVRVDADPIWIQDGNIYTSAGVTAGMDLALRFVEEDLGSAMALAVARRLVLFLRRPGGQAQFSVSLATQAPANSPLFELQVWMAENLAKDLTVEALASRVAMSPRNFARAFVREFGITPARYVERLRLEAARQRLELASAAGLEETARACGFGSGELLRRAFLRAFGVTPGRYREHFGSGN